MISRILRLRLRST